MFFTLNRCTLQLNMMSFLKHVLHAEPLRTSAKHALVVAIVLRQAAFLGLIAVLQRNQRRLQESQQSERQ